MTDTQNQGNQPALPFTMEDLAKIRVRPAQFARMVCVSRQTVSSWIKEGKVTLGADGRLEPQTAMRQVVANSDPGRLRARVIRTAVEDTAAQRRLLREAEMDRDFYKKYSEDTDTVHDEFVFLLNESATDLVTASNVQAVQAIIAQALEVAIGALDKQERGGDALG